MSQRVALGVLGCSAIARRRTLPAVELVPELSIAAVASRSAEKAAGFADDLGAVAMSYQELIDSPDVDAVYISLPTGLHYEWTLRALRAGKHVLCEKPLTGDAAQTSELTELAGSLGLVLRENFAFLHHPQHARVRELVDGGRIGTLRTFAASFGIPPLRDEDIRYDRTLGGGALLDVGVYPLRAAQLLLGGNLSVAGASLRVDEDLGVELAGHALLVSDQGVFADLDFGFQHSYRSRYMLWGSSAALTLDRAFTPPAEHRPLLRIDEQDHAEQIVLPPSHQFRSSLSSFTCAVLGDRSMARETRWLQAADETSRLVAAVRDTAVRVPVGGLHQSA